MAQTFKINSKRNENGFFAFRLSKRSRNAYVPNDPEKRLLFTAIMVYYTERFLNTAFHVVFSDSDGLIIHLPDQDDFEFCLYKLYLFDAETNTLTWISQREYKIRQILAF